jgi:hypothetical protein
MYFAREKKAKKEEITIWTVVTVILHASANVS